MEDLERNMREIREYQQLLESDKDSDIYKLESQRKYLFRISGTKTLDELDYWMREQERQEKPNTQNNQIDSIDNEKRKFMGNITYILGMLAEKRKAGINTPFVFWH